jgi:hypothetical protein
MRPLQLFTFALALCLAGSAQAAVKFYDSSSNNGEPHDLGRTSLTTCPPIANTPDGLEGFTSITDDNTGTVTLEQHLQIRDSLTDLGEGQLVPVFGPGAFIFVRISSTTFTTNPVVSNTSGIGTHGPSGTDPGESIEWGVVSGWAITGLAFCLSSPVESCEDNVGPHGATVPQILESATYDLGTWNFDTVGDLEAANFYIARTSVDSLSNITTLITGSFMGASLPALPLVGFGALALSLAVLGGRALLGKR